MMIRKQIKKIIDNIELILLVLILVVSILNIRNNTYNEQWLIAINAVIIIYFVMRIIRKNPIKIIKSPLDIFVALLVLSTAIPLICNTYISLYSTVISIMNYITMFWIYVLAREMSTKNRKSINVILNIIIVIAIFFIILGIENLTTNVLFSKLNVEYFFNGEERLVSVFGNPNTLAVFIAFAYFISLDKLVNSADKKSKIVYGTTNTILILGLILTYSKAMYVIFTIMLIAYMIITKNKEKNIQVTLNTIISIAMGATYTYIFIKLLEQEEYLAIWILSILGTILAFLVNMINIKLYEYYNKINLKKTLVILLIFFIVCIALIDIELNNSKHFVVFNETSTSTYNSKKIKNIKPNTKYVFSFNMATNCNLTEDIFTIDIIQRDNRNIEISRNEVSVGKFSGTKNIEVETASKTSEIKIEFKVKYKDIYKEWIINQLKINDKEVILEYKHLPTKLVEKISDINLNYKTAQERIQFIKDGFKLIQQNFLTGIGDNGWALKYKEVQEYNYEQNYLLSYITQVWLEYGIMGLIGFLGIIISILKNKSGNLGLKIAILTLIMHSTIDLDMNFIYIRLLFFIGLGILIAHKDFQKNKKDFIISILCIVVCVSLIAICLNPEIYNKKLIINELENSKNGLYVNSEEYKSIDSDLIKECKNITKYERDNFQLLMYNTKRVRYAIKNEENLEELLEEYYREISQYKDMCNYDIGRITQKAYCISNVIKMLEKKNNQELYPYMTKLAKINIEEYGDTSKKLEKAINSTYGKGNISYHSLFSDYEYCVEIYNKYCSK